MKNDSVNHKKKSSFCPAITHNRPPEKSGDLFLYDIHYNYPYNLHQSVPPERRAVALNDLVCLTYEERSLDPKLMTDIEVHEPLRPWLADRV